MNDLFGYYIRREECEPGFCDIFNFLPAALRGYVSEMLTQIVDLQ